MQIIKARFLKDGQLHGREYTYYTPVSVEVGDIVHINASAKGIVTQVDVPEEEIESFKDKIKTIIGKVEENSNVRD